MQEQTIFDLMYEKYQIKKPKLKRDDLGRYCGKEMI